MRVTIFLCADEGRSLCLPQAVTHRKGGGGASRMLGPFAKVSQALVGSMKPNLLHTALVVYHSQIRDAN